MARQPKSESGGRLPIARPIIELMGTAMQTPERSSSDPVSYYSARYYDPTVGRFLNEDPSEWDAGDMNLYRYVGNDPIYQTDPIGLINFGDLSDAIAGAGDSLTFGLTGAVRDGIADLAGISKVSRCSTAYRVGEYTEVAMEISLSLGSAGAKRLAANASRSAVRAAAEATVAPLREGGSAVHHVNPLFGHPGGVPALFPTGGLPAFIHSNPLNLAVIDAAEHAGVHQGIRQAENAGRIIVNPATTGARAVRNVASDCGCN
jgi:RHS repeat-associated protein